MTLGAQLGATQKTWDNVDARRRAVCDCLEWAELADDEEGAGEELQRRYDALFLPKPPKVVPRPALEQVRKKTPVVLDPEPNSANLTPVWLFRYADIDHEKWGLRANAGALAAIHVRFQALEQRTWKEILQDKSNHEMDVAAIAKPARDRLQELGREFDPLYQLRVDGATRLWGFRSGRWFYVTWVDPDHSVYPVKLKNT